MKIKHVGLIGLVLATGCGATQTPVATEQSSAPPSTTDVVKRQDLVGYSFFDAKLVIPPSAQAMAYSPYATSVVSVMTGEGKKVERGDPIIKLNIPGADAEAASAKSQVDSARTELAGEAKQDSGPVQDAQKVLDDARAAEKAAKDTVAAGGQADVDGATQARKDAEANLKQARQSLNQKLEPSKEEVQSAKVVLDTAREDAAKGLVRAPISGTVVTLKATPGMFAHSSDPLATIINFNAVRIQGIVPPELKDLVTKDAKVIVSFNGQNSDPMDGEVLDVTVAPPAAGQKSSGYLAVIRLLETKALAQPIPAVKRVGIKTGTAKDVLVVPVAAVVARNGKSFVSVKSGDSWKETPVETGISDGALTAIKSGLNEGDTIRIPGGGG
jgi:multidrug resistance efflux pump